MGLKIGDAQYETNKGKGGFATDDCYIASGWNFQQADTHLQAGTTHNRVWWKLIEDLLSVEQLDKGEHALLVEDFFSRKFQDFFNDYSLKGRKGHVTLFFIE